MSLHQLQLTSLLRIEWLTLTTFILAWNSRNFLLANTCMCELTCFRVLVFPVRSLMYRAINSFRPAKMRRGKRIKKSETNWERWAWDSKHETSFFLRLSHLVCLIDQLDSMAKNNLPLKLAPLLSTSPRVHRTWIGKLNVRLCCRLHTSMNHSSRERVQGSRADIN